MTNEEKAKEIALNLFDDGLFYHKYESQRQEIQSAIMKMADWKDEQCNSITKCNLDTLNIILEIIDRKENNETKVEEIEVVANAGYALLKQLADKFNI